MTRLIDPDKVLRYKLVQILESGDFVLASGAKHNGGYERLWFDGLDCLEEVVFETDVFLLTKARAQPLREPREPKQSRSEPPSGSDPQPEPDPEPQPEPGPTQEPQRTKPQPSGAVPQQVWNRLGTRLLLKPSAGDEFTMGVGFSVNFSYRMGQHVQTDLAQILGNLRLTNHVRIEVAESSGSEHRNQIQ